MSCKPKFAERFNSIEMFRYCEPCGRCSSACPITGVDGFNIRRLVRHVELDRIEEIAASAMPWFCAVCGRCEDACPNGIKILDITRTLRAIDPEERFPHQAPCSQACPAGIDIPGYLRLISQGRPGRAPGSILPAQEGALGDPIRGAVQARRHAAVRDPALPAAGG